MTRRSTTIAFLNLVWVVVSSVSSRSAVFHVSPFGSNTSPYSTYQTAAHVPKDAFALSKLYSDTVWIHTGTYQIDTTIDVAGGVTVRGDGQDSSILVWYVGFEGSRGVLNAKGNNEIFDLRFVEDQHGYIASSPYAISGGGLSLVDLHVRNCRFDGMTIRPGGSGVRELRDCYFYLRSATGCEIPSTGGTVSIQNNHFFAGVGAEVQGSRGVYAGGSKAIIENNVFDFSQSDKRGIPIQVDRPFGPVEIRNNLMMGGDMALTWALGTGSFENNTVVGPHEDFHPSFGTIFYSNDEDTVVIRNNAWIDNGFLVSFSNICDDCPPAPGFTFQYSTFWPPEDSFYRIPDDVNPIDIYVDTLSLFNAFPMIADSLYRLQLGSPLIDAGDPSILDPDGSRSDIGWTGGPGGMVYEYLDLPPNPPGSVTVSGLDTIVVVRWAFRPESDTAEYRIYRGNEPLFWSPGMAAYRVFGTDASTFTDTLPRTNDTLVYVVTCVDKAGQESAPSSEALYVVSQNQPNHAPELLVPGGQAVRIGDTLRFLVQATDTDGDTLTFAILSGPEGLSVSGQGEGSLYLIFMPNDDQAGSYIASVEVTDGELSDTGNIAITVTERDFTSESRILRVFPNPVRGDATIEVSVSGYSGTGAVPVNVILHDILGRTVATMFEGSLAPGIHQMILDSNGSIVSGVYFLRLSVDGSTRGELYKVAVLNW